MRQAAGDELRRPRQPKRFARPPAVTPHQTFRLSRRRPPKEEIIYDIERVRAEAADHGVLAPKFTRIPLRTAVIP